MKWFIIIVILLLPCWVGAETYFLRADGSGAKADAAGSGTGSCSAAGTTMSIATHDGETYSGGDTIYLCDDGGKFRDQLDPPSGGGSGTEITYQNASGDTPIISGADVQSTWTQSYNESEQITNGGFDSDTTGWSATESALTYEAGPIGGVSNVGKFTAQGTNYQALWQTSVISDSTSYKVTFSYYVPSANTTTDGWKPREGSSTFTWHTAYEAGYDAWKTAELIFTPASGNTTFYLYLSASDDATTGITIGDIVYIDDVSIKALTTNLWESTLGADPAFVMMDGTVGTEDATSCPDNVGTDKEWCHTGSLLYQYSTSDPDTRYTSPGTEVGARTYGIYSLSKDYVDFNGLTVEGSQSHGILINEGSYNDLTNLTVRKLGDGNDYGIMLHASDHATNDGYHTITNSSISDIRGDSIFVQRVRGITISGNTITASYAGSAGNGGDNIQLYDSSIVTIANNDLSQQGSNTIKGCIVAESFDATASGFIIEENECAYGQFGIGLYQADGAIVRFNRIHDTVANSAIQGISDAQDDIEIYGNVIYDITGNGINFCGAQDKTNLKIYNNTIEDFSGNYGICLLQFDGEVKNNIIWDSTPAAANAYYVTVKGGGSVDSDNNIIGPESSNYIYYGGTSYSTLAAYVSGETQDANSTKENPQFTNAASGDFTLKYNSSAYDAGTNLGASYDDCLHPSSSWPSSVVTVDQDLYPRWEIGAYCILKQKGPGVGLMQ
jgi:hypothetical protein